MPDVTLIIEEPGDVIVQRMQSRLLTLKTPAPKVWRQSAACYERIMTVFREMQSQSFSRYSYFVSSASIQ